jgi:hypothetical protein
MNKNFKIVFLIIFITFFLTFLTGFQISIINNFFLKFNIFLFLILLLVLLKKFYSAIFFAWFSGFLIDTVHFATFGITSLTLLILTGFLIIFQKKALLSIKAEGILIISLMAVFFYHFLEWVINNISNLWQEKLSFYFFNSEIIVEFLLTTALLLLVFKCLKITTLEKISWK